VSAVVLIVPAELTADLRGGLLTELGLASTKIGDLTESTSEQPRETYEPWLVLHDHTRRALEEIGWRTPDPPAAVEVDLGAHRSICLRALRSQLRSYTERMEDMQADEQRLATERVQGLHALICAVREPASRARAT
jgi:hypothetical protein